MTFSQLTAPAPGLLIAATVGAAAGFLADHYGGPAMLFALLLGLSFHFLSDDARLRRGLELASTTVLRIGVALLGLRITVQEIAALGGEAGILVLVGVTATVLFGVALSRLFGLGRIFGVLTGGAVAICGASAALAISAVLPRHGASERDTSFAVIGVTTLSTLAMIVYPVIVATLGYGDHAAGLFLGATIHDVAQVVGAGYSISPQAGDVATFTKLLRVAMLLPMVLLVGLALRRRENGRLRERPPILPWFLVAFAALVVVNSLVEVPAHAALDELARFCLVSAVAALGIRTSLKSLGELGPRPVLLMVSETLFLGALTVVLLLRGTFA